MKNVKVHVSIVSLILVLIIIPIGMYSTSLPSVVLGQSEMMIMAKTMRIMVFQISVKAGRASLSF